MKTDIQQLITCLVTASSYIAILSKEMFERKEHSDSSQGDYVVLEKPVSILKLTHSVVKIPFQI